MLHGLSKRTEVQERVNCIKALNDYAEICKLAIQYMSRNSGFSKEICELCASICEKCAEGCGMFEDDHCKECADICNKCAKECRNMI